MTAQIFDHVQTLAGEIGCRMVGTPGNLAAAEYITGALQRAGYQVEPNPFPCPAWRSETTRLTVGGQAYEAYANTFSPSCDAAGPLLAAGTLAELEAADIQGKMLVLYGDLSKFPLGTKAFAFLSERDRRVIEKLETGRPEGVITVNPSLGMRWRMIKDPDLAVPSATVPLQVGLELTRRSGSQARLEMVTHRTEGQTANLIARLPGSRKERIVLCAHYDTKEDTVGAMDNASGAAVLLALAERLARSPSKAGIEFVFFTGEEHWYSPDTDAYLIAYKHTFGEVIAAINMDGIGVAVSSTSLATFACSPAFDECVKQVMKSYPGTVRVDPWPASNHYQFYSNGVPSAAVGAVGPYNLYHSPNDTLEWIGPEKLEEAAGLVSDLIAQFEAKIPDWGRAKHE